MGMRGLDGSSGSSGPSGERAIERKDRRQTLKHAGKHRPQGLLQYLTQPCTQYPPELLLLEL
jgi:hypothetical protein